MLDGECAYHYRGCFRDSVADQRWDDWYKHRFIPAYLSHTNESHLLPLVGNAHVTATCHNVLLNTAPWCWLQTGEMNAWLLDPRNGTMPEKRCHETEHPCVPRETLLRHAEDILRGASSSPRLSDGVRLTKEDAEAIQGIRWRRLPEGGTVAAGDLEPEGSAGVVYLRRVRTKYPVLVALRRDASGLNERTSRARAAAPLDPQGKNIGVHFCVFGAIRGLTETAEPIRKNYITSMRPQRIHIVTNDAGFHPEAKNDSIRDGGSAWVSPSARLAASVSAHLRVVKAWNVSTFLVLKSGATEVSNRCTHCRGAWMKEMCRMTLLSEIQQGYNVDVVFLFRPDAFPLRPITLTSAFRAYAPPQGTPLGRYAAQPEPWASTAEEPDRMVWRLSTTPGYSLVRDRGFIPASVAVKNDLEVTPHTIVFHTRVTFALDMNWIGDPVVFGHWNVVNVFLEHFSVTMGSSVDGWDERDAGEKHQARFYRRYFEPLWKLGVEAGAAPRMPDVRVFDFMFTLFRSNPWINHNLFKLPVEYAAYQEMTIFRGHPTKFWRAKCARYTFVPLVTNLTSHVSGRLLHHGMVGELTFEELPMAMCQRHATPPGLPSCFAQPERAAVKPEQARRMTAMCFPFCGYINALSLEGMCLYVGSMASPSRCMASYSETPMTRR